MKLGAYIYFNSDLKKIILADKLPVNFRGKKVGEITKIFPKDDKLWVEMKIDKNKIKKIGIK